MPSVPEMSIEGRPILLSVHTAGLLSHLLHHVFRIAPGAAQEVREILVLLVHCLQWFNGGKELEHIRVGFKHQKQRVLTGLKCFKIF